MKRTILILFLFCHLHLDASTNGASVSNDADHVVPYNTKTVLGYNTENYDTQNFHSNSVNNSRFTVTDTGYYFVYSQTYWWVAKADYIRIQIRKNNTTDYAVKQDRTGGWYSWAGGGWQPAWYYHFISDTVVDMNAGDYVECYVLHFTDSGLPRNEYHNVGFVEVKFAIERIE